MKANRASAIVAAVFLCAAVTYAQTSVPVCSANSGVDFRIVTDKLIYARNSMMHVKFLITNLEQNPQDILYLLRVGGCASPMGYYAFAITDQKNNQVPMQTCAGDAVMEKVDAVELFTNPKTGIALRPREVFGSDYEFRLPGQKGHLPPKSRAFHGVVLS